MTTTDATPARLRPEVSDLREVRAANLLATAQTSLRDAIATLEAVAGNLHRHPLDFSPEHAGDRSLVRVQTAWSLLGRALAEVTFATEDAQFHADVEAAATLAERGL